MDCVDVSAGEITPVFTELVTGRRAWLAGEINSKDWTIALGKDPSDEIATMVAYLRSAPMPMLLMTPDMFEIPALRTVFSKAREILDHGCGFCVIDALPMDNFDIDEMISCFWTLGQLIERTVAQKWQGTMVYDVTDTKQSFDTQGVRGSYTNVELVFHTDNAFGISVPDYVGLLCRQPAKEGGLSRFCSLYSAHNRMLEQYPDALNRLYQPMLFDRQAEHAPNAPQTTRAPFFSWQNGKLAARANTSLVRKGYTLAGASMDMNLVKALDAMDDISNSEDLWVEAPIRRGQMQYLNNHELGHYRSTFEDFDDPTLKRHLYRTWHRNRGRRTYDE
jgi:hypothetical protein